MWGSATLIKTIILAGKSKQVECDNVTIWLDEKWKKHLRLIKGLTSSIDHPDGRGERGEERIVWWGGGGGGGGRGGGGVNWYVTWHRIHFMGGRGRGKWTVKILLPSPQIPAPLEVRYLVFSLYIMRFRIQHFRERKKLDTDPGPSLQLFTQFFFSFSVFTFCSF